MRRPIRSLVLLPFAIAGGVVLFSAGCADEQPAALDEPEVSSFVGERTPFTSTFDTGHDGWTIFGDAEGAAGSAIGFQVYGEYDPAGGNPGGAVFGDDDMKGVLWFWEAPPKFLGNRLGWYGGTLEFDLIQSNADPAPQTGSADVILAGAGLTLTINIYPEDPSTGTSGGNPGTEWTHYSVELKEGLIPPHWPWRVGHFSSGPNVTAAQLKAVLKDLIVLRIRGEFLGGPDRGGLDNVRIIPPGQSN